MNRFVQLFYGTLFIITYIIWCWDAGRFNIDNVVIIPYVNYRFEWWMPMLYIDWFIKAFASSVTSIFPIMFITMTQSFLNNYVKELTLQEEISSSQLNKLISEYDKIVESVDIYNYQFTFYNGFRIITIVYIFLLCWQFGLNSDSLAARQDFIWVWFPIYYGFLLFFRLVIYCDVSEKNKILKQELTKLIVKSDN